MNYKEFLELMLNYQALQKDFSELYQMGFDFIEGKYKLQDKVDEIFHTAFRVVFTEEGVDWIDWFIFENDWGTKDWSCMKTLDENGKTIDKDATKIYGAEDKDGNPICYSLESTWELLQEYKKK